ncbi:MAG TPA: aminotransferase class IV [Caulobacteraceae bacterium]|nr:aminotransferase class IV [Caulobacteraceae bacterium]
MAGSQDFADDPRNAAALVYLNGEMVPRGEAKVSLFDAGFGMGDGVWEGLRLHRGRLLFLDAHLDRLFAGAKAISLDIGMDRAGLTKALGLTLAANAMTDGVHMRLMATRGVKASINQDPRNALGIPTVAITAEYKTPSAAVAEAGLRLATVSVRCTPAAMFDMRLNSHSRLNLITALLEAIGAGADEALMLDPAGAVSSCNATNFFFVRDGEVFTSTGDYCFNGITRAQVIALCREGGIPIRLGAFAPGMARAADEAFATGTLGGITPVRQIDEAVLSACPGPLTVRLGDLYAALKDADARARR